MVSLFVELLAGEAKVKHVRNHLLKAAQCAFHISAGGDIVFHAVDKGGVGDAARISWGVFAVGVYVNSDPLSSIVLKR
jgi:hypothetical protein